MRLNKNFIIHNDGREVILVSTGGGDFAGLARSNETAGFILECLQKKTTEKEIVARMREKYDAPEAQLADDVHKIIGQLRQIGAIDD